MNNKNLVSIIIPVYNDGKFLARTLKAVIEQDYENIEIILVNDASTDNTQNTAEKILSSSKRAFKIINHEKNLGVSQSRNDGLNASNGEYIWFCDGDDIPDKSFVSILYNKAESENADMVFCNMQIYHENENRYEKFFSDLFNHDKTLSGEECMNLCAVKKSYFASVCNCLAKKDFLCKNSLHFYKNCMSREDSEFAMKAVISATRVAFEKKALYIYIQHSEQSTKSYSNEKNYELFFNHIILAMYRAVRYILRKTKNLRVKNYLLSCHFTALILKQCKTYIKFEERNKYDKILKTLHHKKIRQVLLNTSQKILTDPELFFNTLILIYFPNFYYWARSKKSK